MKYPFECLSNPEERERNRTTHKDLTLAGPCHPPAWLFVPGRRTGKAQRGSLSPTWSYMCEISSKRVTFYTTYRQFVCSDCSSQRQISPLAARKSVPGGAVPAPSPAS